MKPLRARSARKQKESSSSPCNTTMRTSRAAWRTTGSRESSSAFASTERASARMVAFGAENFWSAATRGSNVPLILSKVPLPGGDRAARRAVPRGRVALDERGRHCRFCRTRAPNRSSYIAGGIAGGLARESNGVPRDDEHGASLRRRGVDRGGRRPEVSYEGESGMRLEALARKSPRDTGTYAAAEILLAERLSSWIRGRSS